MEDRNESAMKKHILLSLVLLSLALSSVSQNFQWASSEPYDSYVTWTNKIIHDDAGNTFTCGAFYGSAKSFVIKYDSNGSKLWEKIYTGYVDIASLCCDHSANLYVPVYISGPTATVDGIAYDRANGELLIKYDPSGSMVWLKQSKLNMLLSERTDASDHLIVTGTAVGTIDLGNGIILSTTSGLGVNYLAKFNTNGECIWAQQNDGGNHPLLCNSKGEIYAVAQIDTMTTVGQGSSQVTLDPADGGSYIAKYDSTGTLIYVKQGHIISIAPDNDGNLYVLEPDVSDIVHGSNKNGYLIKYDPSGNVLWKRTHIYIDDWYKFAMKAANDGSLYATGGFTNYMTIDGTTIPDGGNTRAFVTKIDSSGTVKWISVSSGAGGAGAKDITISGNNEIFITGDMGGGESDFGDYSVTQPQGVFAAKITDSVSTITTAIAALPVSDHTLSVYPNPGNRLITLKANDCENGDYILRINNALGKTVYTENVKIVSGEFIKQLDLGNLPKGIYMMELQPNSSVSKTGKRNVSRIVLQ
jgi:hypothetical protein